MKVVVISNEHNAVEAFQQARRQGYITFVYDRVDPMHELSGHNFTYVGSDDELKEKIHLLESDVTVQDEVQRW